MRKRLAPYSIPEPILKKWDERFKGTLLPLQYRAIEDYKLLEGESLLISSPTSSGKTFCGEMALIRAIKERRKAIFLAPLKAVAEEKYKQFHDCYGDIGLKILIGTRDHSENDTDIENGRFDIAVMVYEKFNSLLLTNFDLIGQVGTVVIDEVQMLGDESRGARLELALTKLFYSEYRPQIVALSAVLGEADELAEWLGCRLLWEKNRPVELLRGIATDGLFHFRSHNTGEVGEESCAEGESAANALFENVHQYYKKNQSALVFLKSRLNTVNAARRFVEYAKLEPDEKIRAHFLACLEDEEKSSLLDNLISLLACGVAFHNADLTIAQRMAIEDGYRQGMIKIVFATTTLSTGINLPASTVFIEAQKYNRKGCTGRPGLEPLSWAEYESMSGRAGRVGMMNDKSEVGRAILFASSKLEESILWDYYIDKRPAPIQSKLLSLPTEDIILDLFSSQLVASQEEAAQLLSWTFYVSSSDESISITSSIYRKLIEDRFLIHNGDKLIITTLGMAVAVMGISISGARHVLTHWDLSQIKSDEEIIFDVLNSPDSDHLYLPFSNRKLPDRHSHSGCPLIREFTSRRSEPAQDEIHRLRMTFLFIDWKNGLSALDVENDYNLYLGMMDNLARQTAWLLSSTAAVVRAVDSYSRLPARLDELAFSISYGLPIELREIHDSIGNLLHRGEMLQLYRQGIIDKHNLSREGIAILTKHVSSEKRLSKIEERIQKIKEKKMSANFVSAGIAQIWPRSIEIDGTPIRERFRVRIDGQIINLTGKSFKYLLRLVWSRLTSDNGWLYKEDLECGFNQARYLYRLRQEIGRDFLPEWPLYENNRSGYYRLAAPQDGLKVNVEVLKENPDFEIRQMVGDLAPQIAN